MTLRNKAVANNFSGASASVEHMLDHDSDHLSEASVDFGHLVQKRAEAIFRPRRPSDITALVRWAHTHNKKVVARGRGHSIYGRALVEGGIVAKIDSLHAVDDCRADRVTVDAGATWADVVEATLQHGLTPPVMPNYLDLSVGGVLSVGGIGGGTSRHGMLTDNVLDMQVLTGQGREYTCSPDRHGELFDAVRAGLAQAAIITRATLRLVEAPQYVRRYQLAYSNIHSLTADQLRALADHRFDHLQGAIIPKKSVGWKFQLDGVAFHDGNGSPDDAERLAGLTDIRELATITDMTYRAYIGAFSKLEAALRESGQWLKPHPWLLTFVPASTAESLGDSILTRLAPDDLGPFGQISYYPLATSAIHTRLLRLPREDVVFTLNLIRFPMANEKRKIEQVVADNRTVYDLVRDANGVLYPVSALPMSAGDWKEHFGGQWAFLRDAKQRFNPTGVVASGYDIF